jgi:glycosyltransferase involved in cell wall biosynthesis
MRILVVHNRYRSALPSGENLVVDDEVAALRERGHDVSTYFRSSDEIASWSPVTKARNVLSPIRSPRADSDVATEIDQHRPDVVHVHNLYPLISPSVIARVQSKGIPVVQTVHNHRHVCAKGTYFRDGHVCRDCLGKRFPTPAVAHRCYRDSLPQSLVMATSLAVNRSTFAHVSRFIALTDDIAAYLLDLGVPTEKIDVKPNSVPDPGVGSEQPVGAFVFVGRLSEEKGIALLCDAWRRAPDGALGVLTVVGDGPLRHLVDRLAAERSDVRVVGPLDHPAVLAAIRSHATVVIPSTCPDVFPRVAVESLACGRPLVVTALGGLPSIVDPACGWVCDPTGAALASALAEAATGRTDAHAAAARTRYEQLYSPAVVLDRLEEIYRGVVT